MIDFHIHSIFSDGELIPAEIIRRAEAIGYKALSITDHADQSNIDLIIPRIVRVFKEIQPYTKVVLIPGIEITHVPPKSIPDLAREARKLGAKIIVVHGETIVEPVLAGTNKAAIESDIDILAHPGLISEEEVKEAALKGIYLEISARKGHSLSNGHVAKLALKYSANLVLNTDSHSPGDFITEDFARKVLMSSGLEEKEIQKVFNNMAEIVRRKRR